MPASANPAPSRPPSRRWTGPVIVLMVLALVAAGVWWSRRHPAGTATAPSPDATSASPTSTAAMVTMPPASPANGGFLPPKVLASRPVNYPEQALLNRVEGVVSVKFSVDDTGHVVGQPIVDKSSGSVMLDAMVLEYDLKKWTFQPATLDGKPIPGTLDMKFEFHLDPTEQRALAEQRLAAPVGLPDAPYPQGGPFAQSEAGGRGHHHGHMDRRGAGEHDQPDQEQRIEHPGPRGVAFRLHPLADRPQKRDGQGVQQNGVFQPAAGSQRHAPAALKG